MSAENIDEQKEKSRFTFVVFSTHDTQKKRTFSVGKWNLVVYLSVVFFGIVVLTAVLLTFTPAHRLLPVSDPVVEERYGKQIAAIQEQVSILLHEMEVLRDYNLRLRQAMGEQTPLRDSSLIPASSESKAALSATHAGEKLVTDRSAPSNSGSLGDSQGKSSQDRERREYDRILLRELPLTMPVDGYLSRGYDAVRYHYGIDMVNSVSTPILAAADGNVVFAGWTYDDGLMMMIAHELGYITVYKHTEGLMKNTGNPVKRGEVIALLGNTGKTSSGPHLHFEVWKDGIPYDPANYLLKPQ
jgi:murein DD-endopeptidase MepM/ murein hydrolase activator NlpD